MRGLAGFLEQIEFTADGFRLTGDYQEDLPLTWPSLQQSLVDRMASALAQSIDKQLCGMAA